MTMKNYLMINKSTNIVDNVCVWDGNTETWNPPSEYLMLIDEDTPALVWEFDFNLTPKDWVLVEKLGAGDIGFTWNETTQVLTTNEPKPPIPKPVE